MEEINKINPCFMFCPKDASIGLLIAYKLIVNKLISLIFQILCIAISYLVKIINPLHSEGRKTA